MFEVEHQEYMVFIRTEGPISIDWIREVTGLELPYWAEETKSRFPCGAAAGTCQAYETGGPFCLAIHPDRVCIATACIEIMEQISHHLTTRPDLQELLRSV